MLTMLGRSNVQGSERQEEQEEVHVGRPLVHRLHQQVGEKGLASRLLVTFLNDR